MARDNTDFTAYHYAAASTINPTAIMQFLEVIVVKRVLNDPSVYSKFGLSAEDDAYGDIGNPLLCRAIEQDNYYVTSRLLRLGVNPDVRNKLGQTPLMIAVSNKYRNLVVILLSYGAAPEAADPFGFTALDYAKFVGDANMIRIIQSYAQARAKEKLSAGATNALELLATVALEKGKL